MIKDKKSLGKKLWDSPINPVRKVDNALQTLSIPGALVAEAYEGISGKGDGKFNFKDAMPKKWGFLGDTGTQKTLSSISHPNANTAKQIAIDVATDPTTYIGGIGVYKTVGKKVLKKVGKQINKLKPMKKIGQFTMPHSPLNKNEFDIDYSGAKPVDLGNIPASDFTKAKNKLVKDYGGADNPEYQMEKGAYFWSPKKGKMRSSYLEYPEDAAGIEERYLGKNWDNAPRRQSSQEEVYNMTPNATPEESKAVRDKFDATYMKGRGKVTDTIRITKPTHFKLKENEYIDEDDFENQFDKIKGDSSTFPQFSVQDYSKLKKDKKGFYVTKLKD